MANLSLHGYLMIAMFSAVYPGITLAIRLHWTVAHMLLAIISIPVFIVGWMNGGGSNDGRRLEEDNEGAYGIKSNHKSIGGTCCSITLATYALGVLVPVIGHLIPAIAPRLKEVIPKWLLFAVSKLHAILGVVVLFLGPYVIYTGAPYLYNGVLADSPIVWLIPSIVVMVYVVLEELYNFIRNRRLPQISLSEFHRLVEAGEKVALFHRRVVAIGKFAPSHPGGEGSVLRYLGKDMTEAFLEEFAHSGGARDRIQRLQIARLADSEVIELASHRPLIATITELSQVSHNVKVFKLATEAVKETGGRIYIHLPDSPVKRPYTSVACVNGVSEFAIKMYPKGVLTGGYLDKVKVGDVLCVTAGTEPDKLPHSTKFAVLCGGGTGIAPMIAMAKTKPADAEVILFCWQRGFEDAFLLDELVEIQRASGSKVRIVLGFSNETSPTEGEVMKSIPSVSTMAEKSDSNVPEHIRKTGFEVVYGHISEKLLSDKVPKDFSSGYAWLSGPGGFVTASKKALVSGVGLPTDKVIPLD